MTILLFRELRTEHYWARWLASIGLSYKYNYLIVLPPYYQNQWWDLFLLC
jgi:drug/metabolite transporter (DMT)-like permease